MILEVAILNVKEGLELDFEKTIILAGGIISRMPGYINHSVKKCYEKKGRYILLVNSAAINQQLAERGIQDWTITPARRSHPLSDRQRAMNTTKSRIRSRVEHVFGTMNTALGGVDQRCIGFARNAAMIIFGNLVYNMHRLRFMVAA